VPPIVLDASVTLNTLFADEHSGKADAILTRGEAEDIHVPAHWWFEVRNGLLMAERRGRASSEQTTVFLRKISELPISVALLPDDNAVFSLARRHRLTFYDAAYLELAKREGLTLATFDNELIAAAKAERVPLA
jgi:predicted nucleic acid-binding protein